MAYGQCFFTFLAISKKKLILPVSKIVVLLHFETNISKMPKIYEYFGFIFYFYSNEHEPIHVHVKHGDHESIFELIMMNGVLEKVNIREKHGIPPLSTKDKHVAETFIRKYSKNIIEKWVRFFVMKQQVRSTNIKTKL